MHPLELCLAKIEIALTASPPEKGKAIGAIEEFIQTYNKKEKKVSEEEYDTINVADDRLGLLTKDINILQDNGIHTVADILNNKEKFKRCRWLARELVRRQLEQAGISW